MCYEFDAFFTRARIAEQMRMKSKIADELKKQSSTATPTVPAEPERHTKDQEPVPA